MPKETKSMTGRGVFKIFCVIALVWLTIVLYMVMHLYELVQDSKKTSATFAEPRQKAAIERKERLLSESKNKSERPITAVTGITLQSSHKSDKKRDKPKLITKFKNDYFHRAPSIEYEISRRRIDNYVREMNYFLTDKFEKLNTKAGDVFKQYGFEKFKTDVEQLSLHTMHELELLRDLDGMGTYRETMHRKLSNEVRQRLHKLQNPDDCKKARRLVCTLNKACGYGCQVHHVIYCMIMAYSSNRTMVINSRGWSYSKRGWEGTFLPVSESCRNVSFGVEYLGVAHNTKALIASLPVIDSIYPKPAQLPQAVPRDLADKIIKFHEVPFVWWVGQICAFLFRYQPLMKERINEKKRRIGFKSPIVG